MGKHDALSDRELLIEIKKHLERQEKSNVNTQSWGYIGMLVAFFGISLNLATGLHDLAPLALPVMLLGLMGVFRAALESSKDYYKTVLNFGNVGTIIGLVMLTFALFKNECIVDDLCRRVMVGGGWTFVLLGLILMIIASKPFSKRRT